MKMTNDSYCVVFQGKRTTERYYRDSTGWLKESTRGRKFRATAEQVLNHLLPALAFGDKLGLTVTVEHYDGAYWKQRADNAENPSGSPLVADAGSRRCPQLEDTFSNGTNSLTERRRGGRPPLSPQHC